MMFAESSCAKSQDLQEGSNFIVILVRICVYFCRGQRFDGGRSTVSTVGTICGGKAMGISVDIDVFEPHILAANLAHAIGHNLGFTHDKEGCKRSKIVV